MAQFLSWLYGIANAVYAWFGSQFYYYLNVVENVLNWIVDKANETYQNAITWAYARIRELNEDVNGLFDWVIYQFDNFKNSILEDLSNLYDWVVYQVNNIPLPDISWIEQRLNDFADWVNSIPDNLQNWVWERITEFQSWVWDNFGWVRDAYDYLTGLFSSIPFDLFGMVNDFFTNDLPNIKLFLSNPAMFILDLLWPKIISALCFIIAHALGTIQDDLPFTPPWKD